MLSSALLHCPMLHCSVTSCSMLRCCAARCCDVLCCAVMPSVVCAFVHMPHSVLLLSPSSMFRLAIGHSFAFLFLECHLQMSTRSALLFFYFIFLSPCSNATVLGNSNMTLLFPCSRGSSLCSTFPVPSHNAAYHGYYHGYVCPPHPCPSVDYKIHEVVFFFFWSPQRVSPIAKKHVCLTNASSLSFLPYFVPPFPKASVDVPLCQGDLRQLLLCSQAVALLYFSVMIAKYSMSESVSASH